MLIGGNAYTIWQDVAITRGIEMMPSHFAIAMTDPDQIGSTQITGGAGSPFQLLIGGDLVMTGVIDRYAPFIKAGERGVRIMGRSLCRELVDNSIDETKIKGMQIPGGTLLSIATLLAQPVNVTVVSLSEGNGLTIPQLNLNLGERPFEVIERIARYLALLAFDNERGQLVLDSVGSSSMASGFAEGVNIQEASLSFAMDQRYAKIVVYQTSSNTTLDIAPLTPAATANDPTVPQQFRRLVVISEQVMPGLDIAQQRANWEVARRYGRSQAVSLTTDAWRDSAGTLWQPNALAPVDIPHCRLSGVTWLISQATFRRNAKSGTTAEIVLMPKEAFQPEPTLLFPFDTETYAGLLAAGGGGSSNYTGASAAGPFAGSH